MTKIKPSQRGTPAGASGCTCFKLRCLTRRVTAVYDRALSAAGIRVTQYSLLSHLRGLRGVPISQLAEKLDMDRTTLTRNLKPLHRGGLGGVGPSSVDARVRHGAYHRRRRCAVAVRRALIGKALRTKSM